MKSIIRNTALNGIAFLISAGVNFITVPLLVSHFGLAAFGSLGLFRMLLPTGLTNFFDLSLPTLTTRNIALHRGAPDRIPSTLSVSLLISLGSGLLVALILSLFVAFDSIELILRFLHLEKDYNATEFETVFIHIIFSIVIQLIGSICQSALEGAQRFQGVRLGELLANAGFLALCFYAVHYNTGFTFIILAFLHTQNLKVILLAINLTTVGIQENLFTRPTRQDFNEIFKSIRLMLWNKILTVVEVNIPIYLIGQFTGPAGVGVYDALLRIPRFLKIGFGFLSNTILPVSAKFEAKNEQAPQRRMILKGSWLVGLILIPTTICLIVFAKPLLALWLGAELAEYSLCLGLLMTVLLFGIMVSFPVIIGNTRNSVIAETNKIYLIENAILVVLMLFLLPILQVIAFYIAKTISSIITYLMRIDFFAKEYEFSWSDWTSNLYRISFASTLAALLIGFLGEALQLGNYLLVFAAWPLAWLTAVTASVYSHSTADFEELKSTFKRVVANVIPRM